jgi:hypothetical protein
VPLELETRIYVGGCTGKIKNITEDAVYVSGVYFYAEDGFAESWTFKYNKGKFSKIDKIWHTNEKGDIWDAQELEVELG